MFVKQIIKFKLLRIRKEMEIFVKKKKLTKNKNVVKNDESGSQ